MDVGYFLSRCSGLKPVLAGERNADLDDPTTLYWCTSHLSDILADYRPEVRKSAKVPKTVSICLPDCARRAANTGQIGEACQGDHKHVVSLVAV